MLDSRLLQKAEGIVSYEDPLHLDLDEFETCQAIDIMIANSVAYYSHADRNLYNRQDKMVDYYRGKQLPTGKRSLATWQTPYVENVIYEAVRRIKPIATSRLPDLIVRSSKEPDTAEKMSDVLNTDIQKRKNRQVLGLAHVHEQLFLYACIKARWNPELDVDGDYEFINIYPKNVVWDQTCKTHSADDMQFVAEYAELSVQQVIMMFPKAEEEFLSAIGFSNMKGTQQDKMASKVNICEVWFHWYKQKEDPETGEKRWEKVHGVIWKYKTCVLAKMRNPYFDFEGKTRLFDPKMKEKESMTNEEVLNAVVEGATSEEAQVRTIYYNYFKTPRKPYFFMVYESLGDNPIDDTNRVEQVLYFQDHINDEGRQIIDMNERSAGKVVFNGESMDKKIVENIDWRNTRQAVALDSRDDIRETFFHVPMPAAPAQLYKSKEENRSIAFEMLGVNATTRGVREGDQTLGEAQMFREQDFGFIDDLVEDTINEAAEWMAQWAMQFIRIFYTKMHYKEIIGTDGDSLFMAVNQDFVEDGMVIRVSASAVDKMLRKRLAMENYKLGASDILSYYEDLGVPNAKEKARRAFLQKTAPMMYYDLYLKDENAPSLAQPAPPGMPGEQPPVQQF